jgi:hypothetical protein
MPDHALHLPAELAPTYATAQEAYAGWLESRDTDDFFARDAADADAKRFAGAIAELVAGARVGGVDLQALKQALRSKFPDAIRYGLVDLGDLDSGSPLPARNAPEPSDPSESSATSDAPVYAGFRASSVEPAFTYAYEHHGQPREFRFFERHLTYHHRNLGPTREGFYVIPYSSITHLEYSELDDGPVMFLYAADLHPSAAGSEAEVAKIIDWLTTRIG